MKIDDLIEIVRVKKNAVIEKKLNLLNSWSKGFPFLFPWSDEIKFRKLLEYNWTIFGYHQIEKELEALKNES